MLYCTFHTSGKAAYENHVPESQLQRLTPDVLLTFSFFSQAHYFFPCLPNTFASFWHRVNFNVCLPPSHMLRNCHLPSPLPQSNPVCVIVTCKTYCFTQFFVSNILLIKHSGVSMYLHLYFDLEKLFFFFTFLQQHIIFLHCKLVYGSIYFLCFDKVILQLCRRVVVENKLQWWHEYIRTGRYIVDDWTQTQMKGQTGKV